MGRNVAEETQFQLHSESVFKLVVKARIVYTNESWSMETDPLKM